ncbi:hypothetical protein [Microbulbifer sp.]|uniref:hypothetical protein n=1 Tax=Microbulbifer sp. TaxID=1908541 RepID=UPI00258EA9A1|nr:hypothetical protein [Microbulbifer sp.]
MRGLILTLFLLCFSAQSLALAVAAACDHQGAGDSGMTMQLDMYSAMEAGQDAGHGHHDMPCCEDAEGPQNGDHKNLCQLTCAAGGCGAVAFASQDWQVQPVPAGTLFLPISPSPLAASQRNLLRPPIGA